MYDETTDDYGNPIDPWAQPYQQQYTPPPPPSFGAGLGPSAPPGAVPFTGQSQGNAAASAAAGQPNNLPVNQPGAPAAGGYTGPKDFPSIVRFWQQSHPATAPDMPGLIALLNAQGLPVSTAMHNGMASDDKLTYNGQIYDLGSSLGGPGAQWFSNFSPMGEGGGGSMAIDPSFLQAYTQQFSAPGDAALPQFQSPGAFKPPTAQDILKDPSYLFREGRMRDQVQNSASARGITNSGGTIDEIMNSAGNFASQEYGNIWNRDFNAWNTDWSHALDSYGAQSGRANSVYGRALGEFQDARQQFRDNQDNPFNKIMAANTLGFQAASA